MAPSSRKISAIDFDRVLQHVGPLGPWQYCHAFLLFLVTMSAGLSVVTFAFTGYTPKHRCALTQCGENGSLENATYEFHNPDDFDITEDMKTYIYKSCQRTKLRTEMQHYRNSVAEKISTCNDYLTVINRSEQISCPQEDVIYDRSIVSSSVTETFHLICDQRIIGKIFNSLYLVGMLLGSFLFGIISDQFGRLKAVILSIFVTAVSGALGAVVFNPVAFAILRITCGMGGIGCYMVSYVIAAETTLPSYKIITTTLVGVGFIFGELVLALEAYLIRDWVTLQLVAYLPMLILLGLYFILPESTRWLIARGETEQAKTNLNRRASVNNMLPIPEELFEERIIETEESMKTQCHQICLPNLGTLFAPKLILLRSLNMFFQWFCVTMVYYGLLFASTSLSGNPYKNFTLVVLAELPSIFMYLKLPHWFGRKNILISSQIITGICCIIGGLLTQAPHLATLQIIMIMIGRLFGAFGFGIVFLYTAELFPTKIRNTAIGTCSTIGRIGGITAILSQDLSTFWPPLQLIIFGIISIIAGILAAQFPETRNDKLPENIEEAMNLGQNVRRNRLGFILTNPSVSQKQ